MSRPAGTNQSQKTQASDYLIVLSGGGIRIGFVY